MKGRIFALVLAAATGLTLSACNVTKTEDGELPDVDVEGGQLPKVDVDGPDVTVGQDTHTVVTPDIDIKPAGDTTKKDTTKQ